MANFIIQQRDIDIIRQSERVLYSKVELLNHNFKIIDSIEGNLIKDSYSVDAESAIRRTYNLELHVSDSSFLIGADKKIWIDRYIKPYVGIRYLRTNEIVWYLMGTFAFNDTNSSYDKTTKSLSLSCSDLMCTLNGDRGGQMSGLTSVISEGTNIRNAVIGLLNDAGVAKYRIEEINKTIPYDLEFSVGTTYYQALKEVIDLYAGYEMFFDIDGVFVIQSIPTTKDEASVLDESIINPLVTSENINNTFNNIYNKTEVWGSVIDTDYYTQSVTTSNNADFIVTLDEVTELDNFGKYGIRIPSVNLYGATININNLGKKMIMDDNGQQIQEGRLLANKDYVFKYRKATDDFLLLGQYQAYGENICTDEDCPFSINNLGYEIKQVLQFDELISDSLCQQRAKYEIWLSTRMQDKISLNMVSIPYLDVNWKISYIPKSTNIKGDYIIKSINGSNTDSQINISLIKFSELYPDIV